jgi:F-type H+-transporting ATPase subunit gamma
MAGLKEIRRRIGSVKNTKQITRAMKLVSAAKLRRAQEEAVSGQRFCDELERALDSLLLILPENLDHPFLRKVDDEKPRREIIIAGDRGLCGAYNTNVIKSIALHHRPANEYVALGRRAISAGKRNGWNVVEAHDELPEDAAQWPLDELAEELMEEFLTGRCSEVVVVYTKFLSAMSQEVTREVLLPLDPQALREHAKAAGIRTEQETDPTPEEIFKEILPLYVKARLREAGLHAKASEHASRMTAMDSASRNADDLIEKLRLYYNRARQSAITRELIDIVGGAEAIK